MKILYALLASAAFAMSAAAQTDVAGTWQGEPRPRRAASSRSNS